jgi:hypothetical protein
MKVKFVEKVEFELLPEEIQQEIISYLDQKDLLKLSLSNKKTMLKLVNKSTTEIIEIKKRKIKLYKFAGKHYLTLPNYNNNYSIYQKPKRSNWSKTDKTMKTIYYKVRIDPKTLRVHNGDFTFSKYFHWFFLILELQVTSLIIQIKLQFLGELVLIANLQVQLLEQEVWIWLERNWQWIMNLFIEVTFLRENGISRMMNK